MIDPDFDPLNDLRIAEHNIGQLVQAANSLQNNVKTLVHRHNQQEVAITELVQQHVMVVDTIKSLRAEQQRILERIQGIERILTEKL